MSIEQLDTSIDGTDVDTLGDEALLAARRNRQGQTVTSPVEDNGDDEGTETSGDDAVEVVGEAIFNDTADQLNTPDGREVLAEDIDGLDAGDRTDGEATAIEGTLNDLDADDTLDVEVITVTPGQVEQIVTEEGETQAVMLRDGEKSQVVSDPDGDTVLLVSDDLELGEAIEEIVDAELALIGDVAEQNGVVVDYEGLRSALTFRTRAIVELNRALVTARYTYVDLSESVGRDLRYPTESPVGR